MVSEFIDKNSVTSPIQPFTIIVSGLSLTYVAADLTKSSVTLEKAVGVTESAV